MNIGISTADLSLPRETAAQCDPTIDSLLVLLRDGKTEDAMAQVGLIDEDIIFTIGRRVCERWVHNVQAAVAVGAIALLGAERTARNILQTHASEKVLLADLELIFMDTYRKRSEKRRAERDGLLPPFIIPTQ